MANERHASSGWRPADHHRLTGRDSQLHNFNVVRYYEPMKVYYAGPGMYINPKNIDFWAEIPAPPATK
jgi:hypothetical protein